MQCIAERGFELGLPLSVCFWSWWVLLALVFNELCACKLMNNWPCSCPRCATTCHQAPSEQVLFRNILPGACAESTNYRRCNWKCVTGFSQKSASHTLELCAMFATIFPQTPFEQVLSRNLLPEGLCKINQVCAIVYKLMNNCPWNCKCLPLPAHKPRLNRFYPEISFLGGLRKMKQLCAIAYKLINN